MKRQLLVLFILTLSLVQLCAQETIDRKLIQLMKFENFDLAIKYGEKKLERLKGNKNQYLRKAPSILLGMGMVYRKSGDYKKAEEYYRMSNDIYWKRRENGKKARYIDFDAQDELASLYVFMGNYSEAEKILLENKDQRAQRFSPTNPIRYRSDLPYGMLLIKQGRDSLAFEYLRDYILYIKNSNHTSKFEINRLANTYSTLVDLELKRDTLKALEYAKKNERFQRHLWTLREAGKNTVKRIEALSKLAYCQLLLKDTINAKINIDKSNRLFHKFFDDDNYYKISILENESRYNFLKGEFEVAMTKVDEAAQLQLQNIEHNFNYLSEYEKENSYDRIKSTFELFNSIFVEGLLNEKINKNSDWVSPFFRYQAATKGLIINNTNRIITQLNTGENLEGQQMYNELLKTKNELANSFSVTNHTEENEKIKALKIKINQLEKEIGKIVQFDSTPIIMISDIQNKLKQGENYIEIVRANSFKGKPYYIFLGIQSTHTLALNLVAGSDLEDKHLKYYSNTRILKIEDIASFDIYLKPILDVTENDIKNLYISPDGAYNLINLSNIYNPSTKKFTLEEKSIVNLPSISIFLDSVENNINYHNIILFGNPIFNERNFAAEERGLRGLVRGNVSNLPGTGIEIDKIAKLASDYNIFAKQNIQHQATEQQLKSIQSPDILHLATHGFFDSRQSYGIAMMNSGILLSEFSSDSITSQDGVFTSYEASCLDLHKTSLVVLSACETGKGDLQFGEGVFGLQRSFIVAGVDNIIMSMWKVDDNATQELMVHFYQKLFEGMTVKQAFEAAQLELKQNYPDPYYWGAFKLLGK